MTISSTTRKAGPFIGNGSASSFPFTFKVFQASDLLVVQLDTTFDVESTLVLNTNYTVSLNANQNTNPGGTVTLSAGALASGYTLTITSDIDNLQPTDLTNQGGFYPTVINDALDRATIQIQQLQVESDRSIKVPVSSTVGTNLPTPQANDLLGWNSDASALVNVDPGTLATVAAYATAYADTFTADGSTVNWTLTRDPATINNLDVSIDGVTQVPNVDYTLSGTTFSTTSTVPSGRVILVKYREGLPNMSADSQDVRYVPAGTGAVTTTVQAKLRETVSVKDFGAVGDGVTDDTAAIQAALDASLYVVMPPNSDLTPYKITAPLVIPANGTLDISGSRITSSSIGIIRFSGGAGTLIAHNSILTTTSVAASGYAVGLQDQSVACAVKIVGFPTIQRDTNTADTTKGIDMTRFYRSYLEVFVYNFFYGIYADGTTYATYYNVIQKPSIRSGTNGKCIYMKNVNALDIHSPYLSGTLIGLTGIEFDGGSGKNVFGGYIEGFADNASTRGLLISNSNGVGVYGTVFDSQSTTANYAIEISGTSDGCSLYNITPAGGWASSTKILTYTASGKLNMVGNAYTGTTYLGRTSASSFSTSTTYLSATDVAGRLDVSGAVSADSIGFFTNTDVNGHGIKVSQPNLSNTVRESYLAERGVVGRLLHITVAGSNYQSIYFGTGSPEGVYSAQPGSLYMRRDGGAGTCFYVKESGSGNTGWVAK